MDDMYHVHECISDIRITTCATCLRVVHTWYYGHVDALHVTDCRKNAGMLNCTSLGLNQWNIPPMRIRSLSLVACISGLVVGQGLANSIDATHIYVLHASSRYVLCGYTTLHAKTPFMYVIHSGKKPFQHGACMPAYTYTRTQRKHMSTGNTANISIEIGMGTYNMYIYIHIYIYRHTHARILV
jgi:hypothetical protein